MGARLSDWFAALAASDTITDYWWCMEHSVFFHSFTTPQEDLTLSARAARAQAAALNAASRASASAAVPVPGLNGAPSG